MVVELPVGATIPSKGNLTQEKYQNTNLIVSQADADKLAQQGKKLYQAGDFALAVKSLQQAIDKFELSGDTLHQAVSLSNLSSAYQKLGLWEDADSAITNSLNLLQELNSSLENLRYIAKALDVRGHLEFARGQTQFALATWREAGDIYKSLDDTSNLINNRIDRAQVLQILGHFRRANQVLNGLEEVINSQSDFSLRAEGLRNLGNILAVIDDLKESNRILKLSLENAKYSGSNIEISKTLLSLANLARLQHKTPLAIDYYKQAIRRSNNLDIRLQSQLNLLSLLINTKQYTEIELLVSQIHPELNYLTISRPEVNAKINFVHNLIKLRNEGGENRKLFKSVSSYKPAQILAKAIKHARELKDKRAESYAIGTLGDLYKQDGRFSEAEKLTKRALFIAQTVHALDISYQWEWQMGILLQQDGKTQDAIAHYEKAIKTLQYLRKDLISINTDIQFSFTQSVEPVYRELLELLLQEKAPNSENLKLARNTIESLQLAELDDFFRSACLNSSEIVDTLIEQQDPHSAVIYPIILSKSLDVILKVPGQSNLLHYKTAINKEELESTVVKLREYLKNVSRTADVKRLSGKVYQWMIKPFETELAKSRIKTLVFVLDGELRNIPMSVLYDGQQDKYLIEKYAISITPGLQLLDTKIRDQLELNVLTGGVDREISIDGKTFPPLTNVERELKNIQSEVSNSKILVNQKFTEVNLHNQLQTIPFSVVHLATHGEFSSDPQNTFILTWNELLKSRKFDNLLRETNGYNSFKDPNSIDLLVLSACQTAQGDRRAALGLAGVALKAGARSTIATLWSVDDEHTADLMNKFYSELKTGVNKTEALHQAQLGILGQEKRPYFWAPFVLMGNWL
ncbi:CHAT domain-containing protein [Mastigocoleus sp. MO_188.B34]|uniref:CHAT domain-containing protein n=1 Tax=Mastigocoleus sp. MO_188.B34 TaxID=3036635 RepID=UPI002610D9A3|nr:CHAT domain-containing protein [Mastigocoleus sp. MO_188.B34]MDJ0696194.1 CHAT domain-containing protein [Mastigocoleus sp. MO_188.B34]